VQDVWHLDQPVADTAAHHLVATCLAIREMVANREGGDMFAGMRATRGACADVPPWMARASGAGNAASQAGGDSNWRWDAQRLKPCGWLVCAV
jgi:hypothetical protein